MTPQRPPVRSLVSTVVELCYEMDRAGELEHLYADIRAAALREASTAELRAELDRRAWLAEADRETGGPDPYADVLGSMP